MRFLSVCSGIEAASVAWKPLGWQCAGVSEIEAFPRAALEQRQGAVAVDFDDHRHTQGQNFTPLFGDFTKIEENHVGPIDLLVGGTPCQSFSIAGLRGGLDDERGNLALEFLRLAQRTRPRWLVWENVPGVLSSNGGRDFGSILGGLAECGYGFAYRVLDAQFFGVPQRRRRVFVVGYLRDWRRAAAVLFERESLQGDTAPSREKGKEVAQCLTSRTGIAYDALTENFVTKQAGWPADVASTLNASFGDKLGLENQHINSGASLFVPANRTVQTITASYGMGGVDYETKPLVFGAQSSASEAVRRLTPRECERLQGFPDDYTQIEWRKKAQADCPDGPRYKALGNSMAVPVMRWIGERIEMVERLED
ncbi:MAG: DNA (cytosine-5-)-methyltransferase [Epibacterium sp.]|nr:DNA (cytosine-5-)-methyltransferase [Epibacterium sp.]NQX75452.1 DNA (cytosine-5-)-methyltransferase [Epibacterium sp.]